MIAQFGDAFSSLPTPSPGRAGLSGAVWLTHSRRSRDSYRLRINSGPTVTSQIWSTTLRNNTQ